MTEYERMVNGYRATVAKAFTRRLCLGPAGKCTPSREARCDVCPPAFPSLSLMREVAMPAPMGMPKPRIKSMGDGLYRCRSKFDGAAMYHEGFGNSELRAWNAWVCRVRVFIERGGYAGA